MPAAETRLSRWTSRRHTGIVAAALLLGVSALSGVVSAEPSGAPIDTLQRTVDSLRSRLGITRPVTVSVVPVNTRLLSVAPPSADGESFHLEIEADFMGSLTDDELMAALAHELGHVWIASHRPFLQTERLANDIAMRVVPRSSLVRVYRKMSAHSGQVADEDTVLGPELLKVLRRYPID